MPADDQPGASHQDRGGLAWATTMLAREACRRVGLSADGLRPVRLHSNGVFRLPRQRVVVRVGSGADAGARAGRAVAVARWLGELEYPTVLPTAILAQPVLLDDPAGGQVAVTFWREVEIDATPVSPAELGRLLRHLHGLPRPTWNLPLFRPLDRLVEQTRVSSWLDEGDRRWLADRAAELQRALASSTFMLGPAAMAHGDAQLANALRVTGVGPVLADWDGVARAPREWDLVPTAVEKRFGGSPSLLTELLDAYDVDPTGTDGWHVLRDIYELRSVAAHIRRAPVSPPHAGEAARRIASLRRGDRDARWYAVG
ncbi:phosphotransferase family protein [Micromonospora sp. NPDC048063]|uniref:phosphotransferase family protein n=1 Tax=Micromonospora sp. NPDC048063 TaxID=3364256 RepID=UPI003724BA87